MGDFWFHDFEKIFFLSSGYIVKNFIRVSTLSQYIVVHSDTISNKPFYCLNTSIDTNMSVMITIIKLNMTDIGIFFQ